MTPQILDTSRQLQRIAEAYFRAQQEFLKEHPGNEEILSQRFIRIVSPNYLTIQSALLELDMSQATDDLNFLMARFGESLNSIIDADEDTRFAYFYNSFARFLSDIINVLKTAVARQKSERPSWQSTLAAISRELVLELE